MQGNGFLWGHFLPVHFGPHWGWVHFWDRTLGTQHVHYWGPGLYVGSLGRGSRTQGLASPSAQAMQDQGRPWEP